MEFIQARWFSPSNRTAIDLVVVHTMEAHERAGTARAVANWFSGATSTKASAHYCVDDSEVVQCVRDEDVAWHASQVNSHSVGIEHAGFAAQNEVGWSDPYSTAMLVRSASLAARLCLKYDIPVCRLTPEQVRAGERGFCGHVDVNTAWNNRAGHTDPGPSFPWNRYLEMVGAELDRLVREEMASEESAE